VMGHAPVVLLTIPVVATLAGGLLAIRFQRFRVALVAVGAGLLLGAAFLDLLPEAVGLGQDAGMKPVSVLGLTLLFFLLFSAVETWLDGWRERTGSGKQAIGRVGGGLLIFHSFRDGMAIGAAFAASHTAGYAVATGIAAHEYGAADDGGREAAGGGLLVSGGGCAGTVSGGADDCVVAAVVAWGGGVAGVGRRVLFADGDERFSAGGAGGCFAAWVVDGGGGGWSGVYLGGELVAVLEANWFRGAR